MLGDKLTIPIKPDDTLIDIMRRAMGAIPGSNQIEGPNTPGWQWNMTLAGLTGAIERYCTAIQESSGLAARIAVGEALWWVAAADDFFRDRISQMDKSRYYRELAEFKEGRILAGLVYLRHRAGHRLALALEAKSEPAFAHFDVIQEDGSLKANTAAVTISYNPELHETCPKDGFYFTQRLNDSDYFGREAYYKDYIADSAVEQILTRMDQAFRKALSISQSGTTINVHINGHPLPIHGDQS